MNQSELEAVAEGLDVKYQVIDNLKDGKKTYRASFILTNNSDVELKYDKNRWEIHFCHIRMLEPGFLPCIGGHVLEEYGVRITHLNGCVFKLEPTKVFKTLSKGDSLKIDFKAQYYSVARSDLMPNWYITCKGLKPCLIKSTVGEEMEFVQSFDSPSKWKRFDYTLESGAKRYDHFDPYTVEGRFKKNKVEDLGKPGIPVIPTPVKLEFGEKSMSLKEGDWTVIADKALMSEAQYLSEKLSIPVSCEDAGEEKCTIKLQFGKVDVPMTNKVSSSHEAYKLTVSSTNRTVNITGTGAAGVFYGVQTLISLAYKENVVPDVCILDAPRYPYRGMHLDVSRNFHNKEQVLKLLEAMAMYKMNKFHFHLTDDEGWRIEIPGLEELTTVGARRGHHHGKDSSCLLPHLGSGPDFSTSGTGHYSVQDYKEILQFAKDRHIEVIPEIDMPGHSHAAIKAMRARYEKYKALKDIKKAEEYLLTDMDEIVLFRSVQMFSENAMNPGLESSYRFADKVIKEIKELHKDIQPLKVFHLGGDEVPFESWEGSPACQKLIDSKKVKSFDHLMEYFVVRVADIVAKHNLNLGAWQDGVIHDEITLEPVKRSEFKNKEVYAYAWQNVWESGLAGCAYRLANKGYKVIMSQGTHLYFDHPYEPDPEERGLYWATRCMDTRKTFGFMPDSLYLNADIKLTGEVLPEDFIKTHEEDHDPLEKPENILGIQGQLWTELVRKPDQMDYMIFPRLLALAERAWHKASWEIDAESDNDIQHRLKTKVACDWEKFANSLGYKELERLDTLGVEYRLPPPGAMFSGGKLEMCSAYPHLPLFYSRDDGATWQEYKDIVDITPPVKMAFMTKSPDQKRSSRKVTLEIV